jgi:hypothetical protein
MQLPVAFSEDNAVSGSRPTTDPTRTPPWNPERLGLTVVRLRAA